MHAGTHAQQSGHKKVAMEPITATSLLQLLYAILLLLVSSLLMLQAVSSPVAGVPAPHLTVNCTHSNDPGGPSWGPPTCLLIAVACIGNHISQSVACLDSHNSWCVACTGSFSGCCCPYMGTHLLLLLALTVLTAANMQTCNATTTRAGAPSWGRAVVLAGVVNLCRQPLGCALYNRPVTTK